MTTAAVILAAGAGSRFTGPTSKLLATVRGKPVVQWAVENSLAAGLDDVLLVFGGVPLRAEFLRADEGVVVVANQRWAEGIATSLAVAVEAAAARGHDRIVVGLGDQPGIPPAAWRAVATARQGPIVVATYGGVRGNPVRLDAEVWPLLPADGDEGARLLMRSRPDLVREVACEGDPRDIDTVEDLEAWS